MSPILNTLACGRGAGQAKMSPRIARLASSTVVEFWNSVSLCDLPAASSAPARAGMMPSLAAIAVRFMTPPITISHIPAIRRLA